jgi:hypothetical protein
MAVEAAVNWRADLDAARADASEGGKPIYLDFWGYG